MSDKKIRVLADVSQLDTIKEKSASIMRETITASKEYLSLNKEIQKSILEQLEALRSRNNLLQSGNGIGVTLPTPQISPSVQTNQDKDYKELLAVVRDIYDILSTHFEAQTNQGGGTGGGGGTPQPGGGTPGGGGGTTSAEEGDGTGSRMRQVASKATGIAGGMATAKNDIYAAAAIFGAIPVLGGAISSIFTKMISSVEDMESSLTKYTRLAGGTVPGNVGVALGMGSGYSGTLGVSAAEFISRQADLIEAQGGKRFGSRRGWTEAETISLMAGERKLGLDPGTVNQLQSVIRFASESGTQSASSVIKSFERVLKDGSKTTAEIASTMREYLDTFTSTAGDLLNKTGSINASAIAQTLLSVQSSTGFEGKQLRRVQESLTGKGMATDEVTKAIQLRAARRLNPGASYSELMSKIENLGQDVELQKEIFDTIRSMTRGGEDFNQAMKAAYPELSYTDIANMEKRFGGKWQSDISTRLFKSKRVDPGARFGVGEAEPMVGRLQASTKTMENLMAGYGDQIAGQMPELTKVIGLAADGTVQLVKVASEIVKGASALTGAVTALAGGASVWDVIRGNYDKPPKNIEAPKPVTIPNVIDTIIGKKSLEKVVKNTTRKNRERGK